MDQRGRKRFPWIKLWFDDLSEPVPRQLTIAEKGCWWGIQILAGKSPVRCRLLLTPNKPMTVEDIARALSLTDQEKPVLESTISKMIEMEELAWNSDCLVVVNWKARQDVYPSDLEPRAPSPHGKDTHPDSESSPQSPKSDNNSVLAPQSLPISSVVTPPQLPLDDRREKIDDRVPPPPTPPRGVSEPFQGSDTAPEQALSPFGHTLQKVTESKNPQAVLFGLVKEKWPGYDWAQKKPSRWIAFTGDMVKGFDAERVLRAIWAAEPEQPVGNPLNYVKAILLRGGRSPPRGGRGEAARGPEDFKEPW